MYTTTTVSPLTTNSEKTEIRTETTTIGETAPRVIKKYQNRKLYDTQDSCYITLDEIAKLIQKGEDVAVVDNRTKKDVTSIILTQILVDQEKSLKSILPIGLLKEIIRNSNGSLFEFVQRYVLLGMGQETTNESEAVRYVERMTNRGELTKNEGKSLVTQLTTSPNRYVDELTSRVQRIIDESVRRGANLNQIEEKINRLGDRLSRLESSSQI